MSRLKKMLSEKQKKIRRRNNTLNLQITVLGWMVEIFGFFSCLLGVYILGHGNSIVTSTLHTISMINYYIILPSSILINSEDTKEYILDHESYSKLLRWFGCESSTKDKPQDKEIQIAAVPNAENQSSPPNSGAESQMIQNRTIKLPDHQIDARTGSKENAESVSKEETKKAWMPNSSRRNGKNGKILRQREIDSRKTEIEQHSDDSKVRKEIKQNRRSQDMYVEDLDVSHDV